MVRLLYLLFITALVLICCRLRFWFGSCTPYASPRRNLLYRTAAIWFVYVYRACVPARFAQLRAAALPAGYCLPGSFPRTLPNALHHRRALLPPQFKSPYNRHICAAVLLFANRTHHTTRGPGSVLYAVLLPYLPTYTYTTNTTILFIPFVRSSSPPPSRARISDNAAIPISWFGAPRARLLLRRGLIYLLALVRAAGWHARGSRAR